MVQGTFDNNCQCQLEKDVQEKGGPEAVHDWVWCKFFRVDAPKFGNHVLFARQAFSTTGQVYRQRLYTFQLDNEDRCLTSQIYKLKDESWFEKAEENSSCAADLDPVNDAEFLDGCGVYWNFLPDESRFHGATKEGMCRFESRFFPGKTIIASSDIYLSPRELWTLDRGVDTDGNKMYGFKSDEHHKFLRREVYKGCIEYEGDVLEVTVHNQGGEVTLNGKYVMKLEQAVEVETKDKVLRLSVHAEGQEKAVGKTMADWNATEINGDFDDIKIRLDKVKKL